jgi:hypothetical protein
MTRGEDGLLPVDGADSFHCKLRGKTQDGIALTGRPR